ncbi:hypothetical protein ACIOMM_07180 [Streptomyces sp. NPDC087908]|uniref:hypothetical protein n=1 Tax=unclassified Streptomyces TaxID=2593676 RepID=UPI0011CE21B1|nr:hypothetical protein [Streptomyces sp. adm13(2018)]MYS11674.1 hypothetical protein [Streptomyces sp. SID6041]TXS26243.1 hypothetical protein EAO70_04065 [Streptomyces sp. adm13(2018)]
MQISDSVTYVNGGAGAETAAQDDPIGEVTLGTGGLLGRRGRLLRTADVEAVASWDMPYTTGTITVS